MYKQVIFEEGSWGRWVQKKFQKYIGFAPCIFHGRGLFSSDTWGLVPYSKPITTVGESLACVVTWLRGDLVLRIWSWVLEGVMRGVEVELLR